jgi:hypothetical protein
MVARGLSALRLGRAIGCQLPAASLRLKVSPITSVAWPSHSADAALRCRTRTFIRPKALPYSQAWPMQTVSPSALRITVG